MEIGKRWVGAGLRVDHTQLDLGPESKEDHEGFHWEWGRLSLSAVTGSGRVIQRKGEGSQP